MKNDIVKHADLPDLGIGKVLEHAMGDKVRIFFLTCGEKKFDTNYANLVKLEGEEATHPLLENLMIPDKGKKIEYRRMDELVKEFLMIAPEGFNEKKYQDKSRAKKLEVHTLMTELLNEDEYQSLLDDENYDEICERALKVVDKINLIAPSEKKLLKAALEEAENRELFSQKLHTLLYKDEELRARFNRFASCLHTINAAKWTIQTFFLFVLYPNQYLFLKPTTSKNAAHTFSFDLNFKKELNWDTYNTLLSFGTYITNELEKLGEELHPKDMIDVQSFAWSVTQGKLM